MASEKLTSTWSGSIESASISASIHSLSRRLNRLPAASSFSRATEYPSQNSQGSGGQVANSPAPRAAFLVSLQHRQAATRFHGSSSSDGEKIGGSSHSAIHRGMT